MKEVEREQARKKITFDLIHNGSPNAKENVIALQNIPEGVSVLFYRTKYKPWEGPHIFLSKYGE